MDDLRVPFLLLVVPSSRRPDDAVLALALALALALVLLDRALLDDDPRKKSREQYGTSHLAYPANAGLTAGSSDRTVLPRMRGGKSAERDAAPAAAGINSSGLPSNTTTWLRLAAAAAAAASLSTNAPSSRTPSGP